jgi:sigma-B regulation protein RsbU (phosphoserine phosphatase)
MHELEMARSIQRSLLPQDFRCFSWMDAAGESIPCFEIGGDYFDVIRLDGDECLFVIADVSGKGPAAALRAATVQGNIQALCAKSMDLGCVLQKVNEAFRSRASETAGFVTACLAVLNGDGRVRYANGGHNLPIYIPASGGIAELSEGGPLIGLLANASFPGGAARMTAGDLLLLYTDGVTDCENENGETFGVERLQAWAAKQSGRSPEAVRVDLIHELKSFSGTQRHPDDLTFLVVQYLGR